MTPDDLRAAADQLVRLHERFAPLFGRKEARQQSLVYLHGLLLGTGRKNAEAMALEVGTAPGRTHQTFATLVAPPNTSVRKAVLAAAFLRLRAMLSLWGCCLSKLSASLRNMAKFAAP